MSEATSTFSCGVVMAELGVKVIEPTVSVDLGWGWWQVYRVIGSVDLLREVVRGVIGVMGITPVVCEQLPAGPDGEGGIWGIMVECSSDEVGEIQGVCRGLVWAYMQ